MTRMTMRTAVVVALIIGLGALVAAQPYAEEQHADSEEAGAYAMAGAPEEPPEFEGGAAVSPESMVADEFGPSPPEGVPTEEIIIGRLMAKAEDRHPDRFDIAEFAQMCPDADQIADTVVQRLKETGMIDMDAVCSEFEERAQRCQERGEKFCSQIKDGTVRAGPNTTFSCPVEQQEAYDFCVERQKKHLQKAREKSRQQCHEMVEEQQDEILKHREQVENMTGQLECDREQFLADCRENAESDEEQMDINASFGNETVEFEDDGFEEDSCEEQWEMRKQTCEEQNAFTEEAADAVLGPDDIRERCLNNSEEAFDQFEQDAEESCQEEADQMVEHFNSICDSREEAYQRCQAHRERACSFVQTAADRCNAITEDDIREYVREMAGARCATMEYEQDRPEFEHLEEASDTADAAQQLSAVREQVPPSQQAVVDSGMADVVNASKTLQQVDRAQAGEDRLGYRVKKALGLAAAQEKKEARQLRRAIERINETIAKLEAIKSQVSDAAVKAAIQQQIDRLKEQRDRLREQARRMEQNAGGILSIFS